MTVIRARLRRHWRRLTLGSLGIVAGLMLFFAIAPHSGIGLLLAAVAGALTLFVVQRLV